jgi:hypothetical protein
MNRREFIRHAAALSGAIVAPALADERGPSAAPTLLALIEDVGRRQAGCSASSASPPSSQTEKPQRREPRAAAARSRRRV